MAEIINNKISKNLIQRRKIKKNHNYFSKSLKSLKFYTTSEFNILLAHEYLNNGYHTESQTSSTCAGGISGTMTDSSSRRTTAGNQHRPIEILEVGAAGYRHPTANYRFNDQSDSMNYASSGRNYR